MMRSLPATDKLSFLLAITKFFKCLNESKTRGPWDSLESGSGLPLFFCFFLYQDKKKKTLYKDAKM